jgi:mono/diheme cytochrome c family protein
MRMICAALLAMGWSAFAQDVSRGALLYETHCAACHREGLHERASSKVRTYADLRAQVERWTMESGHRFTRGEVDELIAFLDASHYRLDLQRRDKAR